MKRPTKMQNFAGAKGQGRGAVFGTLAPVSFSENQRPPSAVLYFRDKTNLERSTLRGLAEKARRQSGRVVQHQNIAGNKEFWKIGGFMLSDISGFSIHPEQTIF
jgi:hypothetical protein